MVQFSITIENIFFFLPFSFKEKEMKKTQDGDKRFHHCEFEKSRVFSVC